MPGCTIETAPRFTLNLSLTNPTFRLPDLYSTAKLFGFGLFHPWHNNEVDKEEDDEVSELETWEFVHSGRSAFVIVGYADEEGREIRDLERCLGYCRQLGERCIMIKSVQSSSS
jgi:hypothetical protein